MFKVTELFKCLLVGVLLICVLSICLLPFMGACTKEVDRYETKVEIVHVDFAYAKYSPRYSMAIANDKINDTIPLTAEEDHPLASSHMVLLLKKRRGENSPLSFFKNF